MTEPNNPAPGHAPSPRSLSFADVAERSQRIFAEWLDRAAIEAKTTDSVGPAAAWFEMTARMMANPTGLMQAQIHFWNDTFALWQNTAHRLMGGTPDAPVVEPAPGDARFKDAAWSESEVFDFIKQSYLLSSRFVQEAVQQMDGADPKARQKIDFYTRQMVDALSPSNFALTNPEVLRRTIETNGDNLVRGLDNFLTDLERGHGRLRITMSDPDAFRLGETIAVTPGKVVFQTELMQLIQYAPATDTVLQRPLLIVPPWINKYYVLDLRPQNSVIAWLVSRGHTVFVISWVNPDERLSDKNFENYMTEGVLAALGAIERATGERAVNAVGYCLGGTLLAATLATMAATGDERIASATFLVTLVDFSDAGDIGVFIDEKQLCLLEERMSAHGYLDGYEMAASFSAIRANDLVWSFFVNNYLLGRDPMPFDLLFWNADSTRMPARMHAFYLRNMYVRNQLAQPGGISLAGVPIDLRRITIPTYILATREDHITPWRSTYAATRLYGGPIRFVLGASGHIAGVINPPLKGKYGHWTNDALPADPEEWLAGATEHAGSWWRDCEDWMVKLAPETVPARIPGAGGLPSIEDAPGSYVRVK